MVRQLKALLVSASCIAAFWAGPAQATPTELEGEYILNLTITLTTAVPSGGSVWCLLHIEVTGDTNQSGQGIVEDAVKQATVDGGVATCQVVMPYMWFLNGAGGDELSIHYGAGLFTSSPEVTEGIIANALRSNSVYLPSRTGVPANGTHTTLTEYDRL